MALPLRSDFDADPIRALIGAPVGLGRAEYACVQVLARPVTGRRVQQARRAARRVHTGGLARLVGRLLDTITPGTGSRSRRAAAARTKTGTLHSNPQTSLEYSAQNRAIVGKQRGSQFETVVRYAVATLLPADTDEAEIRQTRDVARGRAHALAASFASYTEHNHYTRHRVRHPGRVIDSRRLGCGETETRLAAYIAKYATKGTGKSEAADRPIRSQLHLDHLRVSDHHRRIIQTCWDLGDTQQHPNYADLNLRRWAHMLGFRGHFLTKSRAYSTTFKQIRADQRAHRLAETLDQLGIPNDDTTLIVNHWAWTGAGYRDDAERDLAAGIADRIRDDRRNRHHTNHEQRNAA